MSAGKLVGWCRTMIGLQIYLKKIFKKYLRHSSRIVFCPRSFERKSIGNILLTRQRGWSKLTAAINAGLRGRFETKISALGFFVPQRGIDFKGQNCPVRTNNQIDSEHCSFASG